MTDYADDIARNIRDSMEDGPGTNRQLTHKPTTYTPRLGAVVIRCSCGWTSGTSRTITLSLSDAQDRFDAHLHWEGAE